MQVDWRNLLNEIGVEWKDRGPNTSRNNVNVGCRKCGNDPGFHLGISESQEAYYCFREPNRHSGRNFIALLVSLGCDRPEASSLLNRYQTLRPIDPHVIPSDPKRNARRWASFASAADSRQCLDYLAMRGFVKPLDAAARYDIHYAPEGSWAQRLLLPFKCDGELVGWTGRALRSSLDPRYLTEKATEQPYIPDGNTFGKPTLVIVEGPLDALKVAVACQGAPFIVAGLAGKALPAGKLLVLRNLAKSCQNALVALDADVSMSSAYAIISTLAASLRMRYIDRLKLPSGYKDPADIDIGDIVPWLASGLRTM